MSHVFIVGFMGAGKSTVGEMVADRLNRRFVDLDEQIVRRDGRDIPTIFAQSGESGFRDRERDALRALRDAEPAVVACGGGAVTDEGSREELRRQGCVVYLEVSAEEAVARIGDADSRPLLAKGDARALAEAILASRSVLYDLCADATVDTIGRSPEEVANLVFEAALSCLKERAVDAQ